MYARDGQVRDLLEHVLQVAFWLLQLALLQKFCLRMVVREITLLQTSSWLEV